MKILVIHNYHRNGSASGDDFVFNNETSLLENNGHTVIRYTVRNDEFDNSNILKRINLIFGMLWSTKHYKEVEELCKKHNPDLVHVHTFFPLLSPSILYAAKRNNVKVIATLHDTRFICPCATSLRNNRICNSCGDGHYFRMFKYKCFKQSRLQSLIVAFIFKYHRLRQSFYKQIDSYICLNENQIELLKEIGFDEHKIVKKYNFINDVNYSCNVDISTELPLKYVVFYGRIGEEKGINELMRMWDDINDIPLVVMGGGPCEKKFKEWSKTKENVYFLGYTQREQCLNIVKNCEFVVFPSIWYEGCSMVEIEAESMGKCLIVYDIGFSSECIIDGYNGYKVQLGDTMGFVNKIYELWNNQKNCVELGKNARQDFLDKYSIEKNYLELLTIYKKTLNKNT